MPRFKINENTSLVELSRMDLSDIAPHEIDFSNLPDGHLEMLVKKVKVTVSYYDNGIDALDASLEFGSSIVDAAEFGAAYSAAIAAPSPATVASAAKAGADMLGSTGEMVRSELKRSQRDDNLGAITDRVKEELEDRNNHYPFVGDPSKVAKNFDANPGNDVVGQQYNFWGEPLSKTLGEAQVEKALGQQANSRVSDGFSMFNDRDVSHGLNSNKKKSSGALSGFDDPLDTTWSKPLGDVSWPDETSDKSNWSNRNGSRDELNGPPSKPNPIDPSDPGRNDPPIPSPKPNRNKGNDRDWDNSTPDRSQRDRDTGRGDKSNHNKSKGSDGGYDGRGGSSSSDNIGSVDRGTCFVGSTLVLLANGDEKPISEIALEDKVMAFNRLGALEPREVTDLYVHGKRRVLNVDGTLVTPEHPYLMPDGSFRPIGELSSGDMVVQADGSLKTIERIEEEPGLHTVYNFTVEGLHTYVAAGLRVHNKFVDPVMLDLDGDGLEVTELSKSDVYMDTGGDGFLHRTAWAGVGDGILFFDPDGRDAITEKRQFIFTEWDPTATSDLEALASVFDRHRTPQFTDQRSFFGEP